jgi:hypothetical protein
MVCFKVPVSGLRLPYDGAVASRIIGIDVGSFVFLIAIAIIPERVHPGLIFKPIHSKNREASFVENVEKLLDQDGVLLGVRSEMHGGSVPG